MKIHGYFGIFSQDLTIIDDKISNDRPAVYLVDK